MAYDLDRLEAEQQLHSLILRYCTALDAGDLDETARLFRDGTWYLRPDKPISGHTNLATFLENTSSCTTACHSRGHVVSNIVLELANDLISARAVSYVIVFQTMPDGSAKIIFQGAYHDKFARGSVVGWHFVERRVHADGTGDLSQHLRSLRTGTRAGLARGQR